MKPALILLLLLFTAPPLAADPGEFQGRLTLLLLDDPEHDHELRVLEEFAYQEPSGQRWTIARGGLLEGEVVPRQLRTLPDLPLQADYRKAAAVHEYVVRQRATPWRRADRLLFQASLDEGLGEADAKRLYLAVYAGGWRWESRPSTCYGSCHAAASGLSWKPDISALTLTPLLDWLATANPGLDEIERRVDEVTRRPGPHLFAQPR